MLAFLRTYLNDPTHIRAASVSQPQLKTVGPGERYVACVRYNARQSDGKYAGSKDGAAVYVAGKLDRFLDGKQGQPYCKDAAYAPFPELEQPHALAVRHADRRATTAGPARLGGSKVRQRGRK